MNYQEIRDTFERLCRVAGITSYDEYLNDWINAANGELCQEFEFPSLKMGEIRNTSDGLDEHMFPYPYDGTDVSIYLESRRIDYWPEEALDLAYSRRTGNRGRVDCYDWAGTVWESSQLILSSTATEAFTDHGVIVENRSPIVRVAGGHFTFVATHVGEWCRFGPWDDSSGVRQDPGEYGYKILEVGTDSIGNYARLWEPYRGPSSTSSDPAPISIRPHETQIFRMYGTPDNSTDEIEVKCWRKPRRLYNPEDVPEYPRGGQAIAYLAIAIGLRHLGRYEEAEVWRRNAYEMLNTIKRRRRQTEVTSPEAPLGRIKGRRVGPSRVYSPRYGRIR